jgi:acetoin utilization protein AcuB
VGIVSDRDCRIALYSPYLSESQRETEAIVHKLSIKSLMTPAPIVIEPSAFVSEAVQLMLTHHINCLPVVLGESLVGIITSSDLLMAFIKEQAYSYEPSVSG